MSMILDPLVTSEALIDISSTKSFPTKTDHTQNSCEYNNWGLGLRKPQAIESKTERRKKKAWKWNWIEMEETFEDELLATGKDVGERLEKGLEVFDGGVRWDGDRNQSAAELHGDGYGGGFAIAYGRIAFHCFLLLLTIFSCNSCSLIFFFFF